MKLNLNTGTTLLAALLFASCSKGAPVAVPGKLSGMIKVSADLATKLRPGDTLYIMARVQKNGPPAAVKRIVNPQFPVTFLIGPEDAMVPGGRAFEKGTDLTLTARLSHGGNSLPVGGDLEGGARKNPVHPGDGGVDVFIDRVH